MAQRGGDRALVPEGGGDAGHPCLDEIVADSVADRRARAEPGAARRAAARRRASAAQPTIPAWHTWYARDDFERVFKKLYRDLGPAGRRARAPIDASRRASRGTRPRSTTDPTWPEQRYLDYLADDRYRRRDRGRRRRRARRLQPRRDRRTCSRATRSSTRAASSRPPDPYARRSDARGPARRRGASRSTSARASGACSARSRRATAQRRR